MKQSLHNHKQSSVNFAQVFEFVGRFIWIQPLQYLANNTGIHVKEKQSYFPYAVFDVRQLRDLQPVQKDGEI